MTGWLIDTLVWTAVLIAAVLVLRRPVARHFGPQVAYALWLLPLVRLIVPPIVLPSWVAPVREPLSDAVMTIHVTQVGDVPAQTASAAAATATTADATAAATAAGPGADWPMLALSIWLVGAALFLIIRFGFYFHMRRELLADARAVGEEGAIRLVETPATLSPVAFGVLDKIVALPVGFMDSGDQTARDLALAHEFAHHRAHDLLANLLVQPLFALHWFNPLGWYGWRAMRRDQEAACDARVIAGCGAANKAAYAAVIASFAAGPHITRPVSLAASMACPVIGEKSIIHRLRSLTMSDISPRRRIAGRALIAAALLAVPLSASVSYAESLTVPNPPPAPAAPSAPVPPMAPDMAPPAPPAPPLVVAMQAAPEAAEAPEAETRVFIMRDGDSGESGDARADIRKERKVIIRDQDGKMSKEEREEVIRELREELDSADSEIKQAMREAKAAVMQLKGEGGDTRITTRCKDGQESGEWTDKKGQRNTRICTNEIMASALSGLTEARNTIAAEGGLDKDLRDEILKALDEKIKAWNTEG